MKIDLFKLKHEAISKLYTNTKISLSYSLLSCLNFLEDQEFEEEPKLTIYLDKAEVFTTKEEKSYKLLFPYDEFGIMYYGDPELPDYELTKFNLTELSK